LRAAQVVFDADGGPTDLTKMLGNIVSHSGDLIAVLIEQKVIIPEVRPLICQWKFLVLR
jgi:hypothetical protein